MLFRDDGCVPPERLLGFRCSPDEPIVIEVGAGTREAERFIGEHWATPMDALPTGAFPIGDGGDMQVFGVPGDEKTLYVARGDDTVERWLRLPRLGASDPPTAFVIGDSIADGAEPSILQSLPGWSIGFDAVIGRGTNSALTEAAAQAAVRPDVVVIELGTNDADPIAFRENGATILETLQHVPLVVWQTAHGPLENIPGVNIHIHGLVSQYPNAVVADWDTFVSDDDLSSDGVHPAAGDEDLMAALIAPILAGWLEVANGGGASSCASLAEAAAGVG
jgi:lysophospholipase L1-like esterase